jgi:hypothetical protein
VITARLGGLARHSSERSPGPGSVNLRARNEARFERGLSATVSDNDGIPTSVNFVTVSDKWYFPPDWRDLKNLLARFLLLSPSRATIIVMIRYRR